MPVALIKEVLPPRQPLCDRLVRAQRGRILWTVIGVSIASTLFHAFLERWT